MKYMLMMNAPSPNGEWNVAKWTQDELKAHVGFMKQLDRDLSAAGNWSTRRGCPAGTGQGRACWHGRRADHGWPFPETKEFLAGFWIIDVDRRSRVRHRRAGVCRPGRVVSR